MAFDPIHDEYEPDDEGYCDVCSAELEWEDCPECGGEGFREHEPDNEEPWGGFEPCGECDGRGGWPVCPHAGEPQHVREEAAE